MCNCGRPNGGFIPTYVDFRGFTGCNSTNRVLLGEYNMGVYDLANLNQYRLNPGDYLCGCSGYGYDYMPVQYLGRSGSINTNGVNTAWSRKGSATVTPYGSTITNNTRSGSKNYNLGVLGSYASGGGNKAWSILGGILNYAKSGGNKSVDASGLVNILGRSIVDTWF